MNMSKERKIKFIGLNVLFLSKALWTWINVLVMMSSLISRECNAQYSLDSVKGGLAEWRRRFTTKKWLLHEYTTNTNGKKLLKVNGVVTSYPDGSRVYTMECKINYRKKGYHNNIKFVAGLIMSWHRQKGEKKILIAGNYYTRINSYGIQSISWENRTAWKDYPVMQSATDFHSALISFGPSDKVFSIGPTLIVNLPVTECDTMEGQFECEALGHPRHHGENRIIHAADYFSFSGENNAKYEKCVNSSKKSAEIEAVIENFRMNTDTLAEEYRKTTENCEYRSQKAFWNSINYMAKRNKWIQVEGKIVHYSNFRILELQGRIADGFRKHFHSVSRFYVFYEPRNEGRRSVEYLFVGYMGNRAQWAELYNFRNFPVLLRAIRDKSWNGYLGTGSQSFFKIGISLARCDYLTGRFFYEAVVTDRKKEVVVEGFYVVEDTLSDIPSFCTRRSLMTKEGRNEDNSESTNRDVEAKNVTTTQSAEEKNTQPKSADNTVLYVVILLICVVIICILLIIIRRIRRPQRSPSEETKPILAESDGSDDDVSSTYYSDSYSCTTSETEGTKSSDDLSVQVYRDTKNSNVNYCYYSPRLSNLPNVTKGENVIQCQSVKFRRS